MNEESQAVRTFKRRLVKELLDYIILKYLRQQSKVAGYDLIRQINQDYEILLSSGTVYAKLYSLERKGLIKGELGERKREFVLTKMGKRNIDAILNDPLGKTIFLMIEKPSKK